MIGVSIGELAKWIKAMDIDSIKVARLLHRFESCIPHQIKNR